ncbi:MAG: hemerythrin domain-containing protein [Terracidiphilus sp.]
MATASQSLRQIVHNQPDAAVILERFHLDLCAQADLPLDRACADLQLSVEQILEKLADAEAAGSSPHTANPAAYSTSRLLQHIVRVHHHRVRQDLPALAAMARKVAAQVDTPEVLRIEALVTHLRNDLLDHITKEENVLFPFIAHMSEDSLAAAPVPHACFHSVARPIARLKQEHESAFHLFTGLRNLTHDFIPPSGACATHTALFEGLRSFETDQREHFHLENDVLFPRAIALEAQWDERNHQ